MSPAYCLQGQAYRVRHDEEKNCLKNPKNDVRFDLPMWPRINSFLNRLEEVLLIFLLVLMVFLAFLPILFRNVIATGLIWIDPLLRHLVLWVALLGASLATRQERHIKIDLLSNYLPAAGQRVGPGGIGSPGGPGLFKPGRTGHRFRPG